MEWEVDEIDVRQGKRLGLAVRVSGRKAVPNKT